MTCSSQSDGCIRAWAKKGNRTVVTTSCASNAMCDAAKKGCDGFREGQCTVRCCDTDGCNAGQQYPGERNISLIISYCYLLSLIRLLLLVRGDQEIAQLLID